MSSVRCYGRIQKLMRSLIYILTIFLMSGICSCRSIQYVPVESVKYDSIYLNKLVRDSIYERDSIYIRESGDTVYKYRDRYIYRNKLVRDTVYSVSSDTIMQPYPVEKQLTRWQSIKMEAGGYAIGVVIILIGVLMWKIKGG